MKNKITKLFLAILTFFSGSNLLFAQNQPANKLVLESTNVKFLKNFAKEQTATSDLNYKKAVELARAKNMNIQGEENGYVYSIVGVDENGALKYYRTYNNTPQNSSLQTANAKPLHTAGITGAGMKVGVWDGGVGLPNHEGYKTGRYTIKDSGNTMASGAASQLGRNHSAHVAGTIASKAFLSGETKGFAYDANVYAYNWDNDLAEMAAAAANTQNPIFTSNHSYGIDAERYFQSGGTSEVFGRYSQDSRNYDLIANNAEYYTIVFAAGNDRDGYAKYNPSRNGKDLLSQGGVSKNTVVVAATRGTEDFSGITGSQSVTGSNAFIASFSNYGPTDDFRIKPDISAKGVDVLSTLATSTSATGVMSGTSMAAPAVTGVLTLWQGYFKQIFDQYMRSATVRALMAHTARETGPAVGPDFMFGWGLIDANKGKEVMDAVSNKKSIIAEVELTQGGVMEYEFTYDGQQPLVATIAWNDPAGSATNTPNSLVPKLVNDLDLRVVNVDDGTVFYPWSLVQNWSLLPTSTGIATRKVDNNRDNIEKVEVEGNTAGKYKLVVNHKGTLQSPQKYSLILSGSGDDLPKFNGTVSVEQQILDKLVVYPNPVKSVLNIQGNSLELQGALVEIYDLTGRKVFTDKDKFNSDIPSINVENLQQGAYVLLISKGNAKKVIKFIKD